MMTIEMLKIVVAILFFALAAVMLTVWVSGAQRPQPRRASRAANVRHLPQRRTHTSRTLHSARAGHSAA